MGPVATLLFNVAFLLLLSKFHRKKIQNNTYTVIMFLRSLFNPCFFTGSSNANSVTQPSASLDVSVGGKVTIPCIYSTSYSNPDLYWYHQKPDGGLQFILYRDNSRKEEAEFAKERFSAPQASPSYTFPLTISGAVFSDSALYFCTLRRTVIQDHEAFEQELLGRGVSRYALPSQCRNKFS
ncbi:T-cell receptor alpha chain V region HPB-MLT [Acipenser ruthenus]|nr:T-cell receptor alpha chain V region HPB-MLT [Acipenser ruthenus]